MAKVMTTVTNIFAAFRRDLSCISGLPPPDEGVWLIWDARDSTANASSNYSFHDLATIIRHYKLDIVSRWHKRIFRRLQRRKVKCCVKHDSYG